MAIHFANGGAPDYFGISFNSTSSLLNGIKTELETAGWIADTDEITANARLVMKGTTTNGHDCFVNFEDTVNTSNASEHFLEISGSHTTAQAIVSDQIQLVWDFGQTNYFYLSADVDAGCVAILPYDLTKTTSAHFGFFDRFDDTNQYAWSIGLLHNEPEDKYIAKGAITGEDWKHILNYFYNWNQYRHTSKGINAPWDIDNCQSSAELFQDIYTTLVKPYYDYFEGSSRNASYQAHLGNITHSNRAILYRVGYKEGLAAPLGGSGNNYLQYQYGDDGEVPPKLDMQGLIKLVYGGLGFFAPGAQIVDPNSGNRYLSGGGRGWQGFRIN